LPHYLRQQIRSVKFTTSVANQFQISKLSNEYDKNEDETTTTKHPVSLAAASESVFIFVEFIQQC